MPAIRAMMITIHQLFSGCMCTASAFQVETSIGIGNQNVTAYFVLYFIVLFVTGYLAICIIITSY